jgi:geranylgeranylglycerol-phosphate geranylgeranyltransferase
VSGLAVRPHAWTEWIHSPPFLAATLMLHLMTSASMILNDIQDYEVDCINNPQRPLVMGTVTEKEANIAVISLFSIYTCLALQYLPPFLDPIWSSALIMITIYTPVLKKICFVKNLACASTIASSVPFVGWSVINPLESRLPDFHWLWLTTRIVFTISLFIEMMLDITDKDGDKVSGVPTIPVVFGEPTTLRILMGIVSSSLWISTTESRDPAELGMILVTYLPLYFYLYKVDKDTYQKDTIINVVKLTTAQLGAYLIMMISHQ